MGYVDRLLKGLLVAGVPLFPACASSSCPDMSAPPDEKYVEVDNPASGKPSSTRITQTAYQRCVDTLDCVDLCEEAVPSGVLVQKCTRVPTDAFASGDESVGLDVAYIFPCEGRRPEGAPADPAPARACGPLGEWLARAAYLEGISVPAFVRLARELRAHGAPEALVRRARGAARDEVRHHRMMTSLARRHGAQPAAVPMGLSGDVRDLPNVAIENAAEGCVRETLGAVVARHQAAHASDRSIRAAMSLVARDETRHAELAHQVDGWARARLGPRDRRRTRAARFEALDAARLEMARVPSLPALLHAAGFPSATVGARIAEAMRAMATQRGT